MLYRYFGFVGFGISVCRRIYIDQKRKMEIKQDQFFYTQLQKIEIYMKQTSSFSMPLITQI